MDESMDENDNGGTASLLLNSGLDVNPGYHPILKN
jgi:hypothetical protein